MPGLDGIRVTSSLVEKYPDIKVVIFSMHHNKHYALEAFKAGASGFVLKGSDSRQLVDAVEKVAAGGKYASPILADELFGDFVESIKKEKGTEPFDALSSREREILTLLAEGLTNREISKKLFIAESTVKTHRVNIMEKLRVNDITGLVRIAVNKGLVSTD
jgi:DNA-binding NarL/FixJ family response regulator